MKTVAQAVLPAGISLVERRGHEGSWKITVHTGAMGEPHHIGNLESEDDQYTAIIDRVYATDPDPANAIKRALANLLQQPWTYAPIMKAIHAFGVLPDPAGGKGWQ